MSNWTIEEYRGAFDVRLNGRSYSLGLPTREDAEYEIRVSRKYLTSDKVIFRDEQGYDDRIDPL